VLILRRINQVDEDIQFLDQLNLTLVRFGMGLPAPFDLIPSVTTSLADPIGGIDYTYQGFIARALATRTGLTEEFRNCFISGIFGAS